MMVAGETPNDLNSDKLGEFARRLGQEVNGRPIYHQVAATPRRPPPACYVHVHVLLGAAVRPASAPLLTVTVTATGFIQLPAISNRQSAISMIFRRLREHLT